MEKCTNPEVQLDKCVQIEPPVEPHLDQEMYQKQTTWCVFSGITLSLHGRHNPDIYNPLISLCIWLLLLNSFSVKFIHVVGCNSSSFHYCVYLSILWTFRLMRFQIVPILGVLEIIMPWTIWCMFLVSICMHFC